MHLCLWNVLGQGAKARVQNIRQKKIFLLLEEHKTQAEQVTFKRKKTYSIKDFQTDTRGHSPHVCVCVYMIMLGCVCVHVGVGVCACVYVRRRKRTPLMSSTVSFVRTVHKPMQMCRCIGNNGAAFVGIHLTQPPQLASDLQSGDQAPFPD